MSLAQEIKMNRQTKTQKLNNIKIDTKQVLKNIQPHIEVLQVFYETINREIDSLNELPRFCFQIKINSISRTIKLHEGILGHKILNNMHFDDEGKIGHFWMTAKQKTLLFKNEKNRLYGLEIRKINGPYVDPDTL